MKHFIHTYLASPFWMGLFVFLVSALSLGGALISQYFFGLHPCVLCIYQRWPHGIIIGLGLIALLLHSKPKTVSFLIFISSAAYAIGAGFAFFHVGVEQLWWSGTDGCGIPKIGADDFDSFKQALMNAPVTRCDEIPWQMFGISMAGYNALLSAGMFVVSFIVSICIIRKANRML